MSQGQGIQGPAGVPYLGSKISLISKAEIRYEGTLYTIDPQEATVALAKVRSFGTEDRPTDRPLPARNEIFEFIIFRGHDIKDLHVCEPPQPQPTEGVPLDPAIVKSSQPPPGPAGAAFTGTPSGYPPGQMYQPFVQPMYYGQQPTPGFPMQPSQSQPQQQLGSTRETSPRVSQPVEQRNRTPPAPAYGARSVADSQSSSPPLSRKSPTSDQGVQVRPGSPESTSHDHQHNNRHPPPRYPQHYQQQHQQHRGQGMRRGSGHYQDNNNIEHSRDRGERVPQASYARERINNRGHIRGGPPRGGQRGGVAPRGHGHRGGRSAEPLKFDTDFDFETSNAQFAKDDVEKELRNLSLHDRSLNGDKGEEEPEVEEDEEEEVEEEPVYYDIKKSFFDNISCEATDRPKGQRFSWREERKLNSETFGVSENFRRNYRGRGNWRGGNMRGGWRGRGGGGGGWGDGGYRDGGRYNRGRGGYSREGGGRYYGSNAGGGGQGRRNWEYDDRRRKDNYQRFEAQS